MANLKEIRTRITSVKSTKQITSAMKMVSAAKLRKAQDKIVRLRPYAGKLQELLLGLSARVEDEDNQSSFARVSESEKVLVVVITSNRGLCGAFNSNVIKEAVRVIDEEYGGQRKSGNLSVLTIGKKGFDYFRKRDYRVFEDHSPLFDDLTFENASLVAGKVMDLFVKGDFDRVDIVYNRFRNAAVQDLTHERFLPVEPDEKEVKGEENFDYIFEPSREEIMLELIPRTLKVQFYRAILDSYVAEHGARMTAMHMATDNATELISTLTLEYNKARQASITNQILEVVSGAEALKG
ncbi:MAG: ATP synthase F1 subunit gamma [Bacteroidales bacterium]